RGRRRRLPPSDGVGERRACRARRARHGEQVDDVAHRAYAAACDAELVAAAQAGEQIPAPLEREVRARHERTVRLVALAEAVTEIDVALQPRRLRGTDRQQSVRD